MPQPLRATRLDGIVLLLCLAIPALSIASYAQQPTAPIAAVPITIDASTLDDVLTLPGPLPPRPAPTAPQADDITVLTLQRLPV